MNYQEYLASNKWQELREEAIKRANGRCQLCNSTSDLRVHHRKYPKIYGTEPITDLTVLCNDCHAMFHEKKRRKKLVIPKGRLQDKTLSWRATGILAYIESLGGTWEKGLTGIVKYKKDGIQATRTGMMELVDKGYLKKERLQAKNGRMIGYLYTVTS